MSLVIYCVLLRVSLQTRASFRFLTVFIQSSIDIDCTCLSPTKNLFPKKHLYEISYERHQLISCFVTKLERKIIENQLHASNRNIKRMVLLPIVRISSHIMFLVISVLCIAASTFTKQNKFSFLKQFYLAKHRYIMHLNRPIFHSRTTCFQKTSHSYRRHQLFSCFIIKLERKIIENQLCYTRTQPSKRGAQHESQKQN